MRCDEPTENLHSSTILTETQAITKLEKSLNKPKLQVRSCSIQSSSKSTTYSNKQKKSKDNVLQKTIKCEETTLMIYFRENRITLMLLKRLKKLGNHNNRNKRQILINSSERPNKMKDKHKKSKEKGLARASMLIKHTSSSNFLS